MKANPESETKRHRPSSAGGEEETPTFWTHLDELRSVIIRVISVTAVFAVVAFCFKDEVFSVVLAPRMGVELINTELAQQFIIHMKVSFFAGLLVSSPYILYQLFRFVSPALYADERRYVVRVAGGGYLMFIIGVLFSYFLVLPFVMRFLGTYQVDASIPNTITIDSYISTFTAMTLTIGLVFEMPVLCWLFAKLGFITTAFMRHYRRHAIVLIIIAAAIITPTTDVFTLLMVALPMWLLYELSILVVGRATKTVNHEDRGFGLPRRD